MDSIKIDTGEKRIAINDDPNRVIVFNPSDVGFAERFYKIIGEFEQKQIEYQERYAQIEKDGGLDATGLPKNAEALLALTRETCDYFRGRIDYLFGEGTSQTVFGDAMVLNMFEQFFAGITPFIQSVRSRKVAQYIPAVKPAGKKTRRK